MPASRPRGAGAARRPRRGRDRRRHLQRPRRAVAVSAPAPRRVIDRLREAGAKRDRLRRPVHRADRAPGGQRADHGRAPNPGAILSTTEVDARGEGNVFGGEGVVEQFGARAANTFSSPTPAGSCGASRSPSMDGELRRRGRRSGRRAGRSTRADAGAARAWIDFRGPPGTIRSVSFSEVLRGEVPGTPSATAVVVGATAPSLQDVHRDAGRAKATKCRAPKCTPTRSGPSRTASRCSRSPASSTSC